MLYNTHGVVGMVELEETIQSSPEIDGASGGSDGKAPASRAGLWHFLMVWPVVAGWF